MNDAVWMIPVTSILTAIVAALITMWKTKHQLHQEDTISQHKIRREEEKTTTVRQNQIIDRLEHQVERMDRQMQDQQGVINRQQEINAVYREEAAEMRAVIQFLYEMARRFHGYLTDASMTKEPMPPMPTFKQHALPHEDQSSEFMTRTTQQNTTLLHKVEEQMTPKAQGSEP